MAFRIDTDVLIVGAGPVGLTLGMDLARRGIDVTLAETRAAGEPPSVRSNVVSARTMEAFRHLGIARSVREAGLPADYPNDVAIRTTATGFELARVPIPCRAKRYTKKADRTGGGRRQNRRIASIRCSSNPSCFLPQQRCREYACFEAYRIGLVNEIVPAANLIARAEEILKKIAANAPIAIKFALEATNKGMETAQGGGLLLEASYFGLCAATEDKNEGTSAFLEKRAPQFQGR